MNYADRQEDRVIAAIVVPLVLILLLIIILLVTLMVIYRAEKYINTTKSNVLITFSVKDEPGSLAKALKVFMDCNINILGLNTHLHHAEFERDDGSGNKVNYVYCMCKKELEHKSYLERELKEFEVEFKDGNA